MTEAHELLHNVIKPESCDQETKTRWANFSAIRDRHLELMAIIQNTIANGRPEKFTSAEAEEFLSLSIVIAYNQRNIDVTRP